MKTVIQKLAKYVDLTPAEIREALTGIKEGKIPDVQIAGFLMGLMMKGPTTDEIAEIACVMQDLCVPVTVGGNRPVIDTCGTGGGKPTLNVSTSAAIIAAAGGMCVAKQGSRSISSRSGSADVLEALGVEVELTADQAEQLLERVGIAFLYVPLFHPILFKIYGPESQLGIRTIFFTIMGPLVNPARSTRRVLGVYRDDLVRVVAEVLRLLNYDHVLVVHGLNGYDEISMVGETHVCEVKNGYISEYVVAPEDVGLERCLPEELSGGTRGENAHALREILAGDRHGPQRSMVVYNAAGSFLVGGIARDLREGVKVAQEMIDSGKAREKLEEFIRESKAVKHDVTTFARWSG